MFLNQKRTQLWRNETGLPRSKVGGVFGFTFDVLRKGKGAFAHQKLNGQIKEQNDRRF